MHEGIPNHNKKTHMTLVKFNQKPIDTRANAFFDDFFSQFPARALKDDVAHFAKAVPVNIRENETAFIIEVIAPGLEKGDFKVNIDSNLLTISADKKTGANKEGEKMVRREFSYKPFTRTFTLDESIQADHIQAKYENGVLMIDLPKKEEAKMQPKEISIL